MISAWQNSKNWSVSQIKGGNNPVDSDSLGIRVTWTVQDNTTLDFMYDSELIRNGTTYTVDILQSCQFGEQYSVYMQVQGSNSVAFNYSNTFYMRPLFIFWDINYPPNYEGQIPPDTTPEENETNLNSPSWYISNILDNKALFHDQNFNTFDNNPFLCSGDLAPILYYEIFRVLNDQDVLITSGFQSATAQISYDFGQADTERDYVIVGWYSCGDGTIFPNQGRAEFSITRAGTLSIDLFEACFIPEFPFINVGGCINNMYKTINLLYFGQVHFPSFTFNPACHNLNVLDDWLGLPNGYQVCPQIPAFVRQITTPFIAFLLGLVTMGFIKRIRGDFDG